MTTLKRANQPVWPGNIVDYLFEPHQGAAAGARTFLTMPDGDVSFDALYRRVCRVGNLLTKAGIVPGDRVLFSVFDGADFPAIFFGAMKMGAISLPLNTFLTKKDYRYYIKDSGAKAVIVDRSLAPMIGEIVKENGLAVKVFVSGGAVIGFDELGDAMEGLPESFDTYPRQPGDDAFWLYSSGSTGDPKGVVHTHAHIFWATELFGLGAMNTSADDSIICPPKMFFAYGLGWQLYMPLRVGARVITEPAAIRPDSILAKLIKHQPTLLIAVPTLFAGLLDLMRKMDREEVRRACSRLRFCVSGGEVLAPSVLAGWREVTGTDILDGVGTTEMTHMFIINQPGRVAPGSCGRLVEGYTAKIVDENWNELPQGEIGNLFVIGPTAAQTYWNKPEKTAATMRDGGVLTGDKCYLDDKGNYFYVGRFDDMLRVGGIWVSPAEIESTLAEYPEILECAVIGVPDENALVKPMAFVVLRPGTPESATRADDITNMVRAKLAHYKAPRWVKFVNELPKTATGKIQRFRLRDAEAAAIRKA